MSEQSPENTENEDRPEQGTYENPIDHDYNLENLENQPADDAEPEDNPNDDSVNPEPVQGTAEGSGSSYNPTYGDNS